MSKQYTELAFENSIEQYLLDTKNKLKKILKLVIFWIFNKIIFTLNRKLHQHIMF